MRTLTKLSTYVAGASTLALLLSTSAFAESRHHDGTTHSDRSGSAPRDTRGHSDVNRNNRGQSDHGQRAPIVDRSFERTTPQNRVYDRGNGGSAPNRTYDRGNGGSVPNRTYDRSYDRSYNSGSRSYSRDAYRGYTGNDNRSFQRRDSSANFGGRGREEFRNGIPRSDGRVSMLGRVNRFEHERGGYRIWVGGSLYPYWVPESYFFGRHLGIGLDLRLGGIFRNGSIYVDALGWPGDPYYADPYYYGDGAYVGSSSVGTYGGGVATSENGLRGVVDGLDFRAGLLYVRDDSSRRVITVDMQRVDRRYGNIDFGDLHPGDRVSLGGAWLSDGSFAAASVNAVNGY
jgi:hypothetical protein